MDEFRKLLVWQKGRPVFGRHPAEMRMDTYGSYMRYAEYGLQTGFGWEIDHIDPNGPDEMWNLQPLFWLNNTRKGDKTPAEFLGWLLGGGRK